MCAGWFFGGCQAPPEELAKRCRSARHSMPKSKILNGLEFVQRDGDLTKIELLKNGALEIPAATAQVSPD